jgi:hypothetical protein
MRKYAFLCIFIGFFFLGCIKQKQSELGSKDISKVITQLTTIMVHDVTNPPLAARFFAYSCLAGYEIVSENEESCHPMQGLLNNYPAIKKPTFAMGYDYRLSAMLAMIETAAKMQPSGLLNLQFEQALIDSCKKIGFTESVIDSSKHYAQAISKKILAYAKADKYNRISNYTRYTPLTKEGSWYPTPPSYLSPVEPYFNTVRPFTLDSCSQFKPVPPTSFSNNKNSSFYKLMLLNYKLGESNLTDGQRNIAAFWDCNPFAVENDGHMLIGLKKISPGAHWMGITGIACIRAKTNFSKAMKIHTIIAVGLMDSFMCCWDEKYRSNRIRPETAIRKYIDQRWKPLLQTPPFPEYLSGHSCISATSATILTHFFGDRFTYTDNVEEPYGLVPRSFTSFEQAAHEAAESRFWGGIHFKDAIDNGFDQGTKVGNWIVNKLKM